MKKIIVTLLILMFSIQTEATDQMVNNIHSKSSPDKWKLLEIRPKDSDEIWYFRKNLGVSKTEASSSLRTLVYFTVKYDPVDSSGLPQKSDLDRLYDFEENVVPKIEVEASCVFVASVIKGGVKDHLFYVSDPAIFLNKISQYKELFSGFGISIEKAEDPSWKIYDDFP